MTAPSLVFEELALTGDSPDLLQFYCADRQHFPALLESSSQDQHWQLGRYDILFALPIESESIVLEGDDSTFFNKLNHKPNRFTESEIENSKGLPFIGGWLLFLGYELAADVEPTLTKLPAFGQADSRRGLKAAAIRCPAAIIHDHKMNRRIAVAESQSQLQQLVELYQQPMGPLASRLKAAHFELSDLAEPEPQHYVDAVNRAREYIRDGDVFQANLAREWTAKLAGADPAIAVFQRLRKHNPAPFAGIATFGGSTIISSSPERLIRRNGSLFEARPIAGTRPRSSDAAQDDALSEHLLENPKERAEHVMLIDLVRNDLGRVCEPGSIEVNEMMVLESYAHVHHIVSNVRGQLRDSITSTDCIRAAFPGGTITGCPKVRCMEIIAELEGSRGAYTGSLGYLNRNGDLDLNILIRSFLLQGDELSFHAGAGIVADSVAEHELQETRNKARGLLLALADGGKA